MMNLVNKTLISTSNSTCFLLNFNLTKEEPDYILDPQDVFGPNFPGETFRVLKEKEIRQFGEYRTKRLVLEAWGKNKKWL